MGRSGLLPIPVVLALLRILRDKPAHQDDEDALFDAFGAVGSIQVLAKARARLLNDAGGTTAEGLRANDRLDAVLVDMLWCHKLTRDWEVADA